MQQEKELEDVLDAVESVSSPTSIFLYGSQARTDAVSRSDYEIGVVFQEDKYVGRSVLRDVITSDKFNVYPFKLEALQTGSIDTPFQKKIYLRELVEAGRTLRGENVLGDMNPPQYPCFRLC